MALFTSAGSDADQLEDPARAILDHYTRSRFIYPERERRLQSFQHEILPSLQRLIDSAPENYQIHCALARRKEVGVAASVSGYRDGHSVFAIQHATSETDPQSLIKCLLSLTTGVTRTGVDACCIYFTPGNRWAERLVRQFSNHHASGEVSRCRFLYALSMIREAESCGRDELQLQPCASESHYRIARDVLIASTGSLRAEALLPRRLTELESFNASSLGRRMEPLLFHRAGKLVAIAILSTLPEVASLSHLCSRLEIHPAPGQQLERSEIQTITDSAQTLSQRNTLAVLLANPGPSLARGGDGRKAYDAFTWKSDPVAGFAMTAFALSAWYARFLARERPALSA